MRSLVLLGFFILFSTSAWAQKLSYHLANPIGWMHQLPVGEQPGWFEPRWFNIEINHANVWNNKFSMTDERTGDIYSYKADFEQSTVMLNVGAEILPDLQFAIEVPYAYRNGGILDDFIDQFHQFIDSNRFLRHLNDKFGNSFQVEKNGVPMLATEHGEGVSAIKAKLKYWIWKWENSGPGACACGLAVGGHVKFPTVARKTGMSNGSNDYTTAIHFGIPLWEESGIWATAAYTKLGANGTFEGWPMRKWSQMYELSIDFAIGDVWGLKMQGRMESPLFDKGHVEFNYVSVTDKEQNSERIASGWNSLMQWRGSEAIGPRWRWRSGDEVSLLLVEDWGIGRYDSRGDWLYVNNAPDVSFVTQMLIGF